MFLHACDECCLQIFVRLMAVLRAEEGLTDVGAAAQQAAVIVGYRLRLQTNKRCAERTE